jgi:hypothetical protein
VSRADTAVAARVIEQHQPLAQEMQRRHGHDVALLLALACQESAGDVRARRAEPGFLAAYRKGIADVVVSKQLGHYTAWWSTDPLWFATSIGVLQVLNVVAIERGVPLPEKHAQEDAAVSFEAGSRHLTYLQRRIHRLEPNPERRLLLKWNGGKSTYPGEVLAWRELVRRALR